MIVVVHSDYLGYILIRHLNHNTRFTMDFVYVQFYSIIKHLNNQLSELLHKIVIIKFINENVLLCKIMKLKGCIV